jgi:hypothetical protein
MLLTENYFPIQQAWEKEQKEKAMAAPIIGYTYKQGCDAASVYQFEYDFSGVVWFSAKGDRINADKKLAESLGWKEICEIAENAGAEKLEADGMSYFGYKFDKKTVGVLLDAMHGTIATKNERQQKELKTQKAAREAKFAEAKETGKPVKLESHPVECNNPEEECSCDLIATFALPDGTTKTKRIHCY